MEERLRIEVTIEAEDDYDFIAKDELRMCYEDLKGALDEYMDAYPSIALTVKVLEDPTRN